MSFIKKCVRDCGVILLVSAALYGGGRVYYHVTGGFSIDNITSDVPYDPRWDIRSLSAYEQSNVDSILSQKFSYLGKGCQSYVFLSEDGNYVIKFFKYQRFRTQPWLDYATFIPALKEYRQEKVDKKRGKLEGLFSSWKIAFEDLQPETALHYVHLNKSTNLNKTLTIYDKVGSEYQLDLDKTEFLIQSRAQMLCSYIRELMDAGNVMQAKALLTNVINLVLSEYHRGYADNDHALMQNTGVLQGMPVHIDVGQFVKNERVKDPAVYKQELFNKTYKFREWLNNRYPVLGQYLEEQLIDIIGNPFYTMKPHFKIHD